VPLLLLLLLLILCSDRHGPIALATKAETTTTKAPETPCKTAKAGSAARQQGVLDADTQIVEVILVEPPPQQEEGQLYGKDGTRPSCEAPGVMGAAQEHWRRAEKAPTCKREDGHKERPGAFDVPPEDPQHGVYGARPACLEYAHYRSTNEHGYLNFRQSRSIGNCNE
jgi:hypothetical protein